ncbi:hypothetical protein COCNU_contig69551977G000010 [Cocos nucifera]|nr:hypothetical protein [Cocos nucifera]
MRRSTFPVDLNVPAVITGGQNEIGDDNGDSTANETVQTISNITRTTAASTFEAHGSNQVGTSSGTHIGPYMSLVLGLDGRNVDEIPVNTIDEMVPPSQISYRHGNVGRSTSYLGQAHSFSLPPTHEHFLSGSGGFTFSGYMQSQPGNIMGSVMSPTNIQSQYVGDSAPPGHWGGFQSRILQSPAENTGITVSGNNYVPGRTWLNRSPSPLLVRNYSVMGNNVPIEIMSNTNSRRNAFQLAGSLNDPRWKDYEAMAGLNQAWGYQNQFTGGGFLRASPGNNTAPSTWSLVGGHSYQTMVPWLDASTRNPRVDNMHSDATILNNGGQSSEQSAMHDLNGIMEGAVKGDYEFGYWTTHGRPPSPTQASSSVPPLPSGSSLAPQSQGESTEHVVLMADDPLPAPEPSPSLQNPISDKQAGKAIVSPSNEASKSPSFPN